jgi:predicted nucleic acid-binding Zn ribbon protein
MTRADRILPSVLAEVLQKAPLCPEKVHFAWRAAVGPALARATRVDLAGDGVLHVATGDAQWAREIQRSSRLILHRLAALLGDGLVQRIEVGVPPQAGGHLPRTGRRGG